MRFTVFAIAATTALATETTTTELTTISADAAWGRVQADCQARMAATRVELSNGLTLAALIEEDRVEDLLKRLSVAQLSLLDARRAVTSAAKAMNHGGRLGNRSRIIRKAQLACDAIDVDGLHWLLSGLAGIMDSTTSAPTEETRVGDAFFARPEVSIAEREESKESKESKGSKESEDEEVTDAPVSNIDLTDNDIGEGHSTGLEVLDGNDMAEQLSTELEVYDGDDIAQHLSTKFDEENHTETDDADFDEDEFFGVFKKDSRLPSEIQANVEIEARPGIQANAEIGSNSDGSWVFPNGQI
ncbi:MAG: hypothetical protein KVP17_003984 [Porospora cf. gigantea B]|uniref:uncharacterized protein n=1 Tax=Porospora cf. gigantea B TaxID=2853592 RepID=UPI003571CF7D|nr:MAG: hypothetical protein KVP17_003984 [Porospora cf. gigantea B]